MITVEWLQELGACKEGVEWFHAHFPAGTDPAGWTTSEWSALLASGPNARSYIEWGRALELVPPPLAGMATDSDPEVRRWVARQLPPDHPALAGMATDSDPDVRRWVAHRLPPAHPALAGLATDPDPEVRRWVASRRDVRG